MKTIHANGKQRGSYYRNIDLNTKENKTQH